MAEELLGCPFCGSEPEQVIDADDVEFPHSVECSECHASTDQYGDYEEAIAAWNRRAALRSTETEPSGDDIEDAAKILCEWIGYAWDGVGERDISAEYQDWYHGAFGGRKLQGGKPAIRRIVRKMLGAASPSHDREAEEIERLREALEVLKLVHRLFLPIDMQLAEAELCEEPVSDGAVLFSFMGSGASDHVTVGDYRKAVDAVRAALAKEAR